MPNTYIKIASSTVGSGGAANIDFTSIPATYTDLLLLISVRGTTASVSLSLQMTINGGGVTYTDRFLYGTGSAAASSGNGGTTGYLEEIPGASATASTFCNTSVYIPNYTSAYNKSMSTEATQENNTTAANMGLMGAYWTTASVISQITLRPVSGNFAEFSSATLYGINKS
jgi:hypothetical protein